MAAFFAGVVRAPLTGVALILEMTGATHLATVTLAARRTATLTATKVRSQPIYDTLRTPNVATTRLTDRRRVTTATYARRVGTIRLVVQPTISGCAGR